MTTTQNTANTTPANSATSVDLGAAAMWVTVYRKATAEIDRLDEARKHARAQLEAALGDAEAGTLGGVPLVRYSYVTTKRLNNKLLTDRVDPDVLAECYAETHSRRFSLVDPT